MHHSGCNRAGVAGAQTALCEKRVNDPTSVPSSEGERRLRAAVRALLSAGVWCAVGGQLLLVALWRFASVDASARVAAFAIVLAAAFAGFLYLTVGVSQALADRREAVGLRVAVRAGSASYGPFLWMIVKLTLLGGVLLNVAIYIVNGAAVEEPQASMESAVRFLPLAQGVVAFVFVYWLPIVFVRRNFALFETLRAALVTAWQRFPRAGYLAFLTLTPAVLAVLAGDSTPFVALLLLTWMGAMMEWIAYIYCTEWLQDQRSG
jgi:hypothetical protein